VRNEPGRGTRRESGFRERPRDREVKQEGVEKEEKAGKRE